MTKEKILEEALRIYADHGYQGTTMKKIADAVGIKAASIYFFFSNKEQLLLDVFEIILEKHHAEIIRLHTVSKELPTIEALQAIVAGLAKYHRNDLVGTKAYIQLITSDTDRFKDDFSKYMGNFSEWLIMNYQDSLKSSYPNAKPEHIRECIDQLLVIGNGLFWSTIVYTDTGFAQQLVASKQLISALIDQLKMKG